MYSHSELSNLAPRVRVTLDSDASHVTANRPPVVHGSSESLERRVIRHTLVDRRLPLALVGRVTTLILHRRGHLGLGLPIVLVDDRLEHFI